MARAPPAATGQGPRTTADRRHTAKNQPEAMRRAGKTIGWERAGRCRTPPARSTGPAYRHGGSRTASFGEEQVVRAGSECAAPGGPAAAGGTTPLGCTAAVESPTATPSRKPDAVERAGGCRRRKPAIMGYAAMGGTAPMERPAARQRRTAALGLPPSRPAVSPGSARVHRPAKARDSSAPPADVRRNPGRLFSDHQAQRRSHARRGTPGADLGNRCRRSHIGASRNGRRVPRVVARKPEPDRRWWAWASASWPVPSFSGWCPSSSRWCFRV